MNTKLTLTIEKSIIEKAKKYASNSGRSLSDLVESYLEKLVAAEEGPEEEVPDELKDLFGSVPHSPEMDDKAEIRSIMAKKHDQ